MPSIIDVANVALSTIRSLSDGEKRPVHIGEVMALWTYGSYIDGVIEQYQIALHTTKDKELLKLFEDAYAVTISHKKQIDEFMKKEGITPTDGYSIKPESSALIPGSVKQSDKELINVLQINLVAAIGQCSLAASQSVREDVAIMFFKFQTDKLIIGVKAKKLALKKGWLRFPPAYTQQS
ncbi:DUF3231 family protein [Sporolactobacillus sp. CPB3-1]|uniref:DUF3231 family protein n=1 Tax=Sporolactobacillus mangiferae TaxID=2940498 RepID=A0ABT0M8I5_9BACL|nr:DUF3231 family protein [Sporolactobacillus mangiferae]MCL1631182.1 DUF3231 family protein [Sporolactobacillus mangiferae]